MPPAMAFNVARLAMFGGGSFMLTGRFALRRHNSIRRRYLRHRGIDRLAVGRGRSDRRRGDDRVPHDPAAPADQALIGRDQRHVRTDEDPAVARQHLHVEMQVIARAALMPAIIGDRADHLALRYRASADHAGGIQHLRIHVQITEADVLAGLVDER